MSKLSNFDSKSVICHQFSKKKLSISVAMIVVQKLKGFCTAVLQLRKGFFPFRHTIIIIAVEGGEKDTPPDSLFTPCGICRQTLSEFCDGNFEIFILGKDGKTKSFRLGELLPEAFSLKAESEE